MLEDKLYELIKGLKVVPAPVKTERFGTHYEFVIGIGNDETASITMTKEAFEDLARFDWCNPDEKSV